MKKTVAFFLAVVLLAGTLCIPVSAAGYAYMSGPDTVRAGDTITVSFVAGGGIFGGSGSLSYDSSLLTLQSCYGALGAPWAEEVAGSTFVFYDNSMASPLDGAVVLVATFTVSPAAATGANIWVSAEGVTVSDGVSDTGVGTCTYSAAIAVPLSGNANLASLSVSNAAISPAFSAGTTYYSASVPFSTAYLDIYAAAEHPAASVSISNNSLAANGTTDVYITVTAENGATKSYVISTYREKDPNYVESSVNTLNSLGVEGFLLSPVFTPEKQNYAIYVPYETETVTITAEKTDSLSSVSIPAAEALPVGESLHKIVVTAENGAERVYTVTVFRAEPFDKTIEVPATQPPTEPPTQPQTVPTTAPTEPVTLPTEPAEPENSGAGVWPVLLAALLGAALGCGATVLVYRKKKKEE